MREKNGSDGDQVMVVKKSMMAVMVVMMMPMMLINRAHHGADDAGQPHVLRIKEKRTMLVYTRSMSSRNKDLLVLYI